MPPGGKGHVGRRGHDALCGYVIPRDAALWDIEDDGLAEPDEVLCSRCLAAMGKPGPWNDGDWWVRPPMSVSSNIYVGDPIEAWRLNELTWRRVVALSRQQRLTRRAVLQLAVTVQAAKDDPDRQHVYEALGDNHLLAWAAMVESGWCPDAAAERDDDCDTFFLFMAWREALLKTWMIHDEVGPTVDR